MGTAIGCHGDEEADSFFDYIHCRGLEAPMPHLFSIPWCDRGELPQVRILVYGDSLTAGFCRDGRDYHPYAETLVHELMPIMAADVWMCGLSGLTARQLARDLDADVIQDASHRRGAGIRSILRKEGPFDMVFIMAGTNDLSLDGNPDAESILQSIKTIHWACHSAGVRSVSMSIPAGRPVEAVWIEYYALRDRLNLMLDTWARTQPSIALHIDTSRVVPYENHDFWESDGLHLSPKGSAQLGSAVAALIPSCLNVQGQVKRKIQNKDAAWQVT